MTKTERTKRGHWLDVEAKDNAFIVFTCWGERMVGVQGAKPQRVQWMLAQFGIPDGTTLSESFKMAEHWLAYFEDEELLEHGMTVLRSMLEAYEFAKPSATAPTGGQQGMPN